MSSSTSPSMEATTTALHRVTRRATSLALLVAVLALVLMVVGTVASIDVGGVSLATIGLGTLLGVPLVRNVVVILLDRGRQALWALLGILLAIGMALAPGLLGG